MPDARFFSLALFRLFVGLVAVLLASGLTSLAGAQTSGVGLAEPASDRVGTRVQLEGPISSVLGQRVTFTATVTSVVGGANPTGTVLVQRLLDSEWREVGRGTLNAQGVASIGVSGLPLGFQHILRAQYLGSTTHQPSITTAPWLRHTVSTTPRARTTTTIIGPETSAPGERVAFRAQVVSSAGVPVGFVQLRRNGQRFRTTVLDEAGFANFPAMTWPLGRQSMAAYFEGNMEFEESLSEPLLHTVGPFHETTTTLTGPATSSWGQVATFTATVRSDGGVPRGSVRFRLVGADTDLGQASLDAQGVAVFRPSILPVGEHQIVATYSFNEWEFRASSSEPFRHVVTAQTTTSLTGPATSTRGESVTFVATVRFGAQLPGGTVVFRRDGVQFASVALDAGAQARATIASLPVGMHRITAHYAGAGGYLPSESSTLTHTVSGVTIPTTTTTLSGPASSTQGQSVSFSATVRSSAGIPGGTVSFRRDGAQFASAALNAQGVATVATAALPAGTHRITAHYLGAAGYQPSASAPLTHVVAAGAVATTTTLTGPASSVQGTATEFAVAVRAASGTPTGRVSIRRDGTEIGQIALGGGGNATATLSGLPVGTHSLSAHYLGTTGFRPSASAVLTHRVTAPGAGPVNDRFVDRTVIRQPGRVTGTNVGASAEPGQPVILGQDNRPLVWWSFIPPATGVVTIDTAGSDFDTILAAFTGSSLANLQRVAENDDAPGLGRQSRINFEVAAGTAYHIAVAGKFGATGNIVLNIAQPDPAGFIGGGALFAPTDECAPALGRGPHAVTVRYSPSELNGRPSGVSIVWRDGSEHLALWGPMEASGQFFGAAGRGTWTRFVFYPLRPLVRVVQRQIVQPAGGNDLDAAQEIVLRLRAQNFAAIPGCAVTVAAVVRRE